MLCTYLLASLCFLAYSSDFEVNSIDSLHLDIGHFDLNGYQPTER